MLELILGFFFVVVVCVGGEGRGNGGWGQCLLEEFVGSCWLLQLTTFKFSEKLDCAKSPTICT